VHPFSHSKNSHPAGVSGSSQLLLIIVRSVPTTAPHCLEWFCEHQQQ